MKRLFVYLVLISLAFVSCKKEDDIVPNNKTVTTTESISVYGEWLLTDAYMYVDNLETGEKVKFSHFGVGKTTSSLRFSGSMFPFEDIEQNVTKWEFDQPLDGSNYGTFILNGNTSKPFGFYVTANSMRIIENPLTTNTADMQLGGSARPIRGYIKDYGANTIYIYVEETYESIDGSNCKYFDELIMQKL